MRRDNVQIKGINKFSYEQIGEELTQGAQFRVYKYCISFVKVTCQYHSKVHYIRPHENPVTRGLRFSAVSFLLGWWGIPWGFIFTPQALYVNFKGGIDVTPEVIEILQRRYELRKRASKASALLAKKTPLKPKSAQGDGNSISASTESASGA